MIESISGRLLVVDDEIDTLSPLCDLFTEWGYGVKGFASGKEALEVIKEEDFDVLFADLVMPEMDGIELMKAATEINPHLVCVIITGQGTIQTAVEAMKVGAFDYVLKPLDWKMLRLILSRAIEMRRLRMENLQLSETVEIYELCQAIAFTQDLNTILNKVADAAIYQLEADEASIMLLTPEGNELHIVVICGVNRESLLWKHVPIEQGIAGWVARNHAPLTLNGMVADHRFKPIKPR
ncbi:MAG: response regulator, partial [Nitrospirota bacterium]|nr:response regulator [Nitrospirota bacterium]